jgi:predicted nucleic acid-binding Zn ribbon protein
MSEPVRIGKAIGELAAGWGILEAAETARLIAAWERIVGSAVARRCQPVLLKDGLLRVEAFAPAWAGELKYLAPEIVRRVNEELGGETVSEVRISVARPRKTSP